jgi:hypothetical protein
MIMANFIKLGYILYCKHFLLGAGVQVQKSSKQKQEAEVWCTLNLNVIFRVKFYYTNSDIPNINLIAISSVCTHYRHPVCDASAELLINALSSCSEVQEF